MCLAIPGKIVEIYEDKGLRMGKLDFGGTIKKACLQYLPEVQIGDYALVHVGFALSKVDEEEAAKTYQLLEEMGEIRAQFDGADPETSGVQEDRREVSG